MTPNDGWSSQLHAWIEAHYPQGLPWASHDDVWTAIYTCVRRDLNVSAAPGALQWLRTRRYEHKIERIKDQAEARRWAALGPLADWLRCEMARAEHESAHNCIDNTRWAEMRISSQMRRYRRQQENGCCGRHDEVVTHPATGRRFLIGFNYGH